MSGCCDEPGCRRRQPIRLSRSALTGRWYFVTRWDGITRRDGIVGDAFTAVEKHYVGDEVQAQLERLVGEAGQ